MDAFEGYQAQFPEALCQMETPPGRNEVLPEERVLGGLQELLHARRSFAAPSRSWEQSLNGYQGLQPWLWWDATVFFFTGHVAVLVQTSFDRRAI